MGPFQIEKVRRFGDGCELSEKVMGDPNRDAWLIAGGVLYPIATFTLLMASRGEQMGVLSFDPFAFTMLLPATMVGVVVVLRDKGVRLRSTAIAAFAAWMAVVGFLQIMIFAAASAAV